MHDRIHARRPSHAVDEWAVGTVVAAEERHGHWVVTVEPETDVSGGERIELVVTVAVRDLVLGRLPIEEGASPVGERVWYREHGG